MFERFEGGGASDTSLLRQESSDIQKEKIEEEVSLEQLREWKRWMEEKLCELIVKKAEDLGKKELGGLELRELIADMSEITEIEKALESGKFCYGAKRLVYAVHETSFNTISEPVEGRGFSYSYHEVVGEEDSSHPVDLHGNYIDVADGNGDFSLMYVSDEGKEALVIDTDGHGVYADAASRLFTLYLELSRKIHSENLNDESDILDAAFKDTDRFMAKIDIESEKKPTSLIVLRTRYDEARENKTLSAGVVGTCSFMWIEPSGDTGYVLRAPIMETVAEEFASIGSFQNVGADKEDSHILPFLGMDLSEDMTMLELKRFQGQFSENFSLKDIATVRKGTWIMAYSDGLMDCERFDKDNGKWIKLENELPKMWDRFLARALKSNPEISLEALQELWVEELSYIAQKAFDFHEDKREFMRKYKEAYPEANKSDLKKAWREILILGVGSDDIYDSTDDMTLIVI